MAPLKLTQVQEYSKGMTIIIYDSDVLVNHLADPQHW